MPHCQSPLNRHHVKVAAQHKIHHFLLIENDAEEAAILNQAFEAIPDCGTVSIARNMSEAKAYLKGAGVYSDREKYRFPSTILSSLRVDGDSGVDLLAWLKADGELTKVPFVLLTPATTSSQEIADAKSVGSVKVATKPRNSNDLKSMLERLAEEMCSDSQHSCQTDFKPSAETKTR